MLLVTWGIVCLWFDCWWFALVIFLVSVALVLVMVAGRVSWLGLVGFDGGLVECLWVLALLGCV